MAKERVKTALKNQNGKFSILGELILNDDYTFKINDESKNSDWISNRFNVRIKTPNGNVDSTLWGGYDSIQKKPIQVFGRKKNEAGKMVDDFTNKFEVQWEDRFNKEVLETVAELKLITVGVEKGNDNKLIVKKFLSGYDAVAYCKEHVKNGMVLNVQGDLKVEAYDGNVTLKNNVTSIFLSKYNLQFEKLEKLTRRIETLEHASCQNSIDEKALEIQKIAKEIDELNIEIENNRKNYRSSFTMGIILDKNSVGKFDKEKKTYDVSARTLAYTSKWNDKEVKATVPFPVNFEFESIEEIHEKVKKYIFDVKKDKLRVITVEGDLVTGGVLTTTVTWDDVQDDLKELVALGMYTEEQVIGMSAVKGSIEKRMIIKKPHVKKETIDGKIKTTIMIDDDLYVEDDLFLDFMAESDSEEVEDDGLFDLANETNNDDFASFLDNL